MRSRVTPPALTVVDFSTAQFGGPSLIPQIEATGTDKPLRESSGSNYAGEKRRFCQ